MAKFLVDTDVFIDHLSGARQITAEPGHIAYSVITRIELLAGKYVQESSVTELLEPFDELEVDRPIAHRAGQLRRTTQIRLPDAVIAATALEHDLTLTTRNLRDFKKVPALRLKS
jgi:hypothetical protein